jgi:hypothetical protein
MNTTMAKQDLDPAGQQETEYQPPVGDHRAAAQRGQIGPAGGPGVSSHLVLLVKVQVTSEVAH